MLATRDFKPTKNSDGKVLRSRWVRFWFRSYVTSLQQFWNIGAGQKDLIRAEYDLSEKATKIKEDTFLDFKVVAVDSTFLSNQDFSEAPRFVHVVMSERFPKMVAPPEPLEEKNKRASICTFARHFECYGHPWLILETAFHLTTRLRCN